MTKVDKLNERFQGDPIDFTWEELKKILFLHGYVEINPGKTAGSRRKFKNKDHRIISLHKPHPGNIVKRYVIKKVKKHLNSIS